MDAAEESCLWSVYGGVRGTESEVDEGRTGADVVPRGRVYEGLKNLVLTMAGEEEGGTGIVKSGARSR